MGKAKRLKPAKLAQKLRAIRDAMGISQGQMATKVGYEDETYRNHISAFELGTREPSLLTLLLYARLHGVSTDILIDDSLELPSKLQSKITNL